MEKEAPLGEPIIKGLLKFWPKTCSTKEVGLTAADLHLQCCDAFLGPLPQ